MILNFVGSGYTRVAFTSLFMFLPSMFVIHTFTFALSQLITLCYVIQVLSFLCLSVVVVVIIVVVIESTYIVQALCQAHCMFYLYYFIIHTYIYTQVLYIY